MFFPGSNVPVGDHCSGNGADTTRLYILLNVSKDASQNEIKTAYRAAAVKHHPDMGGDAEKFKEITFAYEILSDPDKRAKYDKFGEEASHDSADLFSCMFGGGGSGCRAGNNVHTVGGSVGLTTGGAQDVTSFRDNLANGRMPQLSSLTVEGLFSEYYFETGDEWQSVDAEEDSLVWPAYSFARSADPVSCKTVLSEDEIWMSVGLNSNIQQRSFNRKNLNLVLVIDISGSMCHPIDQSFEAPSKLDLAKISVVKLLSKLRPEDSAAIVLFHDHSDVLQPLAPLYELDLPSLELKLQDTRPTGGTNMEHGLREAIHQFASADACIDRNKTENRIIFVTDDMPNRGCTSGAGMLGLVRDASERNIFTSLLGVGLDFHPDVIEVMSKAKGAWYGSVKNPEEFQRQLDEEFDYMVTPLVFDLQLTLHSDAFSIDRVFGSGEAEIASGQLMRIRTLFPSPKNDKGQTKGGVVLIRLLRNDAQEASDNTIRLRMGWEDRAGTSHSSEQLVKPPVFEGVAASSDYYEGHGIRKAVLLARYASVMRQWIWDETYNLIDGVPICADLSRGVFSAPKKNSKCPEGHILVETRIGHATSGHDSHSCNCCKQGDIVAPGHVHRCNMCDYDLCYSCFQSAMLGDRANTSNLHVSRPYANVFAKLKSHIELEAAHLRDDSVMQEAKLLAALLELNRKRQCD